MNIRFLTPRLHGLLDYAFGVFRTLSFRTHLALDLGAAATFVAAPFLFGWSGLVLGYYLVMAGGVLAVVALSRPDERDAVVPTST